MGRLILLSQFVIVVLTSSHLITAQFDLHLAITGVNVTLSRITLLCRHLNTFDPVANAEYVFESDNGPVVINSIDHGLLQVGPGEVAFTISQEIEGLYYCKTPGDSLRSMGRNFTGERCL